MLITSIQIASQQGESKIKRIQRAEAYLQDIYADSVHPQQILFPEIWSTGFFAFDDYKEQAEQEQGDTYDMMSAWAKKLGSYIHTGSFIEKDGEDYYNTSLLLNPQGCVVGKYRKLHLFGFGSRETGILTPGSQITVVQTEYGKVGLSTCYDLRFPEFFRTMANLGAQYFLVTSAWPLARVEHWKLFNQVRAIENQCYLISCNGTGTLNGSKLGGHSMIVDPWGEVSAHGDEHEAVIQCDIEPAKVRENRENFPALRDKRLI
jgi:predicted amidohydrolase